MAGIEGVLFGIRATCRLIAVQQKDALAGELLLDARKSVDYAGGHVSLIRKRAKEEDAIRELMAAQLKQAGHLKKNLTPLEKAKQTGTASRPADFTVAAADAEHQTSVASASSPVGTMRRFENADSTSLVVAPLDEACNKDTGNKAELQVQEIRRKDFSVPSIDHIRAAMVVEKYCRRMIAKRLVVRRVAQLYFKVWSEESGEWYFVNAETGETSWEPPPKLNGDVSCLLTPRTFHRRRKNGELKLELIHKPKRTMNTVMAATRLQALVRRRLGQLRKAAELSELFIRVFDDATKRFYYSDTATGAASWIPPSGLSKFDAEKYLLTPRAFSARAQSRAQASSVTLPPGWVEVLDEGTGATYFANMETGESSWEAPLW